MTKWSSEPWARGVVASANQICLVLFAMYCANVELVDNAPPVALNKKRIKAGKVPLYTYKTLYIATSRKVSNRKLENEGDRHAPRLHLRRGHIRRIDQDRLIWVQPCMVGNVERGRVDQAYAVVK